MNTNINCATIDSDTSYINGSGILPLYTAEKYNIIMQEICLLNRRSGVISCCRHQNKLIKKTGPNCKQAKHAMTQQQRKQQWRHNNASTIRTTKQSNQQSNPHKRMISVSGKSKPLLATSVAIKTLFLFFTKSK